MCFMSEYESALSWASIENFPGGQKLQKNLLDIFTRNRSENMFNLLHFRMFSTFLSTYHTNYHKKYSLTQILEGAEGTFF